VRRWGSQACWAGSKRLAAVLPTSLPGPPFGGVHLDFSQLADPPIWAVPIPQPRLERLLAERAGELGASTAGVSDDAPMTLTEFQDSIRRVLGADLPLGDVTRLSRYGFQARQAERYRHGRILLAGDAAHQFPATGIGRPAGHLSQRTPLRRRTSNAADPGTGGTAARAGPSRASTGPSSSTSPAAPIFARPRGTGSLVSTSTPPKPVTGQPTPC